VPRGSEYVRFISDLAGFDPKQHDGRLETILPAVMSWLATRPDAVLVPTPREVLAAIPDFRVARKELDSAWGGDAPWNDVLLACADVALAHKLIPDIDFELPLPSSMTSVGTSAA
jgi:hypothetical protein